MNFLKKYYWGIIPILGWIVVCFGFGFNGLYGQDSYAYLLHAREWNAFLLGGNTPGPFFWPPNYSIVSGFLALIAQSEFLALQLVSVGSMIGIAWVVDRWIKRGLQWEEPARIAFVTLTILLSPYLFRLGQQSMSDMLTMFLLTTSFYHLWAYLKTEEIRSLLLWALVSALALTTRYPAIVVLLPAILLVASLLIRKMQLSKLVLGVAVALIPIALAIWWKTRSMGVFGVTENELFQQWSLANFFGSDFHGSDTNSSFALPNLLFNLSGAIHPGAVFFGALLLPFSFKGLGSSPFRIVLLISILAYSIFLSGVPFQNSRVMSFTFPLIALFLSFGFKPVVNWLGAKHIPLKVVFSICLVIQLGLCARAMHPSIKMNHFERELSDWVEENHIGKTVYTYSFSQLFDTYKTGNPVIQIYDTAITSFDDNAIIIFNESLTEFKIKGTMPHQTWEALNSQMAVHQEKCWPNGWCVYSLESK